MAKRKRQSSSNIRPEHAENWAAHQQKMTEDTGSDTDLERVELLAAGAGDRDDIEAGDLGEKLAELAVTTDEELDALQINLLQGDERPSSRDGSGLVVDKAAEDRVARFTEADPLEDDLGAASVEPGRDDTSAVLRRHHPKTAIARSDAVVEDNLDEPMDETITERDIDDGTGH